MTITSISRWRAGTRRADEAAIFAGDCSRRSRVNDARRVASLGRFRKSRRSRATSRSSAASRANGACARFQLRIGRDTACSACPDKKENRARGGGGGGCTHPHFGRHPRRDPARARRSRGDVPQSLRSCASNTPLPPRVGRGEQQLNKPGPQSASRTFFPRGTRGRLSGRAFASQKKPFAGDALMEKSKRPGRRSCEARTKRTSAKETANCSFGHRRPVRSHPYVHLSRRGRVTDPRIKNLNRSTRSPEPHGRPPRRTALTPGSTAPGGSARRREQRCAA